MFWGYHLMLDCAKCDINVITDPVKLKKWVQELVKEIDMVPFDEPQVVHFGHNDKRLEGWTVLQLIETSNIMAHFNDHTGEAYIDIFSCRPFEHAKAIECCIRHFSPFSVRPSYITRQA